MSKPTQAQIDAAAKAIRDVEEPDTPVYEFTKHAEAALTAAAEAGEVKPLPEPELPAGHTEYNAVIADTIERCAQVADEFKTGWGDHAVCREIAAAIRAMKEQT